MRNWGVALLMLCGGAAAGAQQRTMPSGEYEQYLRLLELEGAVTGMPLVYQPGSPRWPAIISGDHPWSFFSVPEPEFRRGGFSVRPLEARAVLALNSAIPRSTNDGVLWAGRGANALLTAGARATLGPVTATLYPALAHARNSDFVLAPRQVPGLSLFAYPWHGTEEFYPFFSMIDLPQRFGPDQLNQWDWGQSGVRMDLGAFTAGVSNENLWWGPGIRNAIVMSTSGPGFPHVDLGTGRPVRTGIGTVEARMIWGELRESDFFDSDATNDRRYLTGMTLGYQPRFLPGLTVGFTRALYQLWPAGGLGAGDILDVFGEFINAGDSVLPNDLSDQLASVTARWVFPASAFEVFVEWARNDFAGSLKDLLVETDHGRAFTAGFQKLLPSGDGRLRLTGELTTLGRTPTYLLRPSLPFYMHHIATQGYTHRGQLLGAGIGPGGQSQYLGLDRYGRGGRWGVSLERIRYDDDWAFTSLVTVPFGYLRHQTDLTVGGSVVRFAPPLVVRGELEITRQLNRYFVAGNDVTNLKVTVEVGWTPTRTARSPRSR